MAETLKDKTVRGTVWSGIDNVSQFGVTFLVSIILARLLSPDDYGLLGIIAIFTAVCTALINAGFTTALIRKKDANDDDYNTCFIVNLVLSLALYAVIYVCSPFIADFFRREELISLTRVTSLSMIIGALALVQQTRLTKRLDFKSQTKITLVSSIVSGVIGIIMAFLGFGVWSLVAQLLVSRSLCTILLWIVNRWTPRLRFSARSFHDLFGFGWKIMISHVLNTVWNEFYQVVVAKFYSPASLGQFTRANHFSDLFSKNLTNVIQRVTYPVLSSIQDDRQRMVSAYRRIIKVTMFVTTICMFFLGAISEPLIYCLIGSKWHEASIYLPIICMASSLYPLHAINLNMLQVQGRSDLFLVLEIIKKAIAIGPLVIGAFIGIVPMLWANLVFSVICFFLNSNWSGKFIGYSSWMQLKDIATSYTMAVIIAIPIYLLKFFSLNYWLILSLQFIIGIALFFSICHYLRPSEYEYLKDAATPYFNKIKNLRLSILPEK